VDSIGERRTREGAEKTQGAHRGLEGEADDSGMNGDAGDEAEVAGDRGARGAIEEATTPREASFRFLASGCELDKADPPGTLSSAQIPLVH
jgi:hypothetical protein